MYAYAAFKSDTAGLVPPPEKPAPTRPPRGDIYVCRSLVGDLTLPCGAIYDFRLRPHHIDKMLWYEGFAVARDRRTRALDRHVEQEFRLTGKRPRHFPAESTIRPLQLKISRDPRSDKRTDMRGCSHFGCFGSAGGFFALMLTTAKPRSDFLLAGHVVGWVPERAVVAPERAPHAAPRNRAPR